MSFANRQQARRRTERRRTQRQTSGSNTSPGASNPLSSNRQRFLPTTGAGGLSNQGAILLSQLLGKNPKNKQTRRLVTSILGDAAGTMINTSTEIARDSAFAANMLKYQSGLENLKTGNAMKLMGAEGAIAGELIGRQGIEQRAGIRETGEQERFNLREGGNQTLRLRGDARGAIRSQGARFYG